MAQIPSTAGRATTRRPVLITDAGMSREQEYQARRRRYATLMAGRVVCVIGAFVAGYVFSNIWLAGAFIAGAAVLPWAAVLIANDRLPKAQLGHGATPVGAPGPDRQLTTTTTVQDAANHPVIEA